MSTDYFQSHTISLILSWIFSIPPIASYIVYANVRVAKNQHWFTGLLLIWILFSAIVLSPFRYIFLQLIIVTAYPYQSFYALITACALSVYIIPFVAGILYGIGLGLPILGVGAIVGFKDSISKTRLFLAAIAAPFLFLVGSYLFYLVLPYAAYSTHWLRAEDVIRATNGPAEYVYKYLVEPWTPQTFPGFTREMGLENLTSRERLRAHVAAVYLGKKQFAYYVHKSYPEYAKRLEKVLLESPQEWPELTNEEQAKLNTVTTKMVMGEPLSEEDLEIVRRVQESYTKRTGSTITEGQIRLMTQVMETVFLYNYEMGKCLIQSFDTKKPYISDELKRLRKKMENLGFVRKSKLDADFENIISVANNEVLTGENGKKYYPRTREDILRGIENVNIVKDNLQKYIKALTGHKKQQPTSSNVAKIDDETRHSIEEFFNGYEHFDSASNLLRGLLSSKDPLGDSEKAMSLLNKTKESLIECNPELLNKAYSGWGDIVSNKFIPSINIYLAGTESKGDKNNLAKADILIVEVGTWLENNWSELLLSLNKKYGYEVK